MSWKKKVLLGTAVLVLVGIVGHSIWGSQAVRALRERVAELEKSERWVAVEALQGPRVPDDENALEPLAAVATWLEERAPVREDPEALRRAPGTWNAEERQTLAPWLERVQELPTRLHAALERPGFWFELGAAFDQRDEDAIAVRVLAARAAVVLTTRAVLAPPGAWDEALEPLGLAAELEERVRGGWLTFYGLRNESLLRVTQALRHLAAREGFPAARFRERLGPLLRPAQERARLAHTVRVDRLFVARTAERLAADGSVGSWLVRPFRLPYFRAHLDQLDAAEDMLPLDAARYREARAAFLANPPESAADLELDPLAVRLQDLVRHLETELALTQVALAILEHRAERGRLPTALDELGARFPDGVPSDPYADAPFLLERDADGTHLRSAGPGAGIDLPIREGVVTLRWTFPETP